MPEVRERPVVKTPGRNSCLDSGPASGHRSGRKICLYLPNLEGGGAERMMLTLAKSFVERGLAVDMVLARAYGPYLTELPPEVGLVDLRSWGVMASIPRLASYLRRTRPEAALVTLPHASVALVLAQRLARLDARLDTKVFIREATTPSGVRPTDRGWGVKGRLLPAAMRLFYPLAHGVVAVSNGVADDLRHFLRLPAEKITTIYNPVVTADLPLKASEPLNDPWFAPGQPPVVLSVGGLRPEKGFPTLVRAFAKVREKRQARLLILGEGGERPRLEALVRELGLEADVRLPGFTSNPFPYMSRAALYVLSSQREGLPGALIQAMACGCPVVSTDCPSGPAEVLEGGRFGRLTPVGDVNAMAEAISQSLECSPERERLRERAAVFSEEDSMRGYMELMLGPSQRCD